jgi:Lysyl oxidase/Bacterial Ig domain/Protein of unknown function (DUF2012)
MTKIRIFFRLLLPTLVIAGMFLTTPVWGAIGIDAAVSKDQGTASPTVSTSPFSTTSGNELLLAFIATDYISGTNTTVTSVAGGGLTWMLAVRTNSQSGTSEVWRAFAVSPLSNTTVTASLSHSVVSSITVLSFTGVDTTGTNGSGAVGRITSASAGRGAPTATLVTTRNNSWIFGVGNDYDNAVARTPGAGQSLVHQDLAPVGDTYWMQMQNSPTPLSGTSVTINDTAPTSDRYNLSIVEVLPAIGAGSVGSISGTISPAPGSNVVTVTLSQNGTTVATTTVGASGSYGFSNVANGTYTVTPSETGFTFSPTSQSVTVNGNPATVPVFTATQVTWTISGTITPAASGATVTLTQGTTTIGTAAVSSSGTYSFSNVPNGTYTVTPSEAGFTFSPTSQSVTVNGNPATVPVFTATQVAWTISGTITPAPSGSGAIVTLTQGTTTIGTAAVSGTGTYSFSNVPNGTYTVTPSDAGFTFTPPNQTVPVNGANVPGVNFTAQGPPPSLKYPDFSVIIPPGSISIVQTTTAREFRYTHDTYNGGGGPLEIQPVYNGASGNYQGYQHVYTLSPSGTWTLSQSIPIAGTFIYHPIHGHFHFPLASFGLYTVASDGSVGTPVAVSPKVGFCINDSFIYNATLPNAGAFGHWGACSDPTSIRGLSIGAVDEYDHNDPGQSVPIDGLPDGTYWFRAVVDPNNFLTESDKSNNETDVKVVITGNTVQVLQTVVPVLAPPPSIAMTTSPAGPNLSGNVTLSATTASGNGVHYLLDGQPLGSGGSASPYSFSWDTTTATNGTHWLAAQTTDSTGRIGTSAVVIVTVANGSQTPPPNSPTIDRSFAQNGHGAVSTLVTTTVAGDVLIAFVAASGPLNLPQSATVTGGSLAWTLVQRGNSQAGTAEIWTAKAAGLLSNVPVTSTLASPTYDQSLTVIAFVNASATGASISGGATIGPPQVGLTSTQTASWTFGVGFDWDSATARTLAGGQTMQSQWVDTPSGDTFWVQSQSVPVSSAGTTVNIADLAPIPDRWNLAAVEVLPGVPPGPDTTPPTVQLTNPLAGSTVSGSVTVAATATDDRSIPTVTFYVDNLPLGVPVSVPPFMTNWDTTTAAFGPHVVTASAVDAAGNVGNATPVSVNVDNTHPPNLIGQDISVSIDGSGLITTPSFSTTTVGDLLVAFVSYDGPSGSVQTTTVSGAGLTWTLIERSNTQLGTSEIWSARAAGTLSAVTVTSQPGTGTGQHGSLTVIAFTNAAGTSVAGRTGAPSGAPDIPLPGVIAGDWVFAVGNDWDNAIPRTPVSGQVLVHQIVDTIAGSTYWVQSTTAPSTANALVDIHDSSPTTDQWNYAAVEIVATHQ